MYMVADLKFSYDIITAARKVFLMACTSGTQVVLQLKVCIVGDDVKGTCPSVP